MNKRERPEDRRKKRDRSLDKDRSRLFTELSVKKLKLLKGETEAVYRDKKQGGLLLRIGKSGVKSWRCQYYDPNERRMRTEGIGEFNPDSPDHVRLTEARDKAAYFRSQKKSILKERAKEAQASKGDNFKFVAERHFTDNIDGQRITAEPIKATIRKLYPEFGDLPFETIKRPDISRVLKKIAQERGKRAADITLVALRKMMTKYAVDYSSETYASPIVRGMQHIENPKLRARKRFLDDKEIRWFWQACGNLGTFGSLAKMCLLTAQRRGKVANMRFDQIDENGAWALPKDNEREKGTGERLLLPPLAQQIIAEQEKLRTCAYVFPSSAKTGYSAFGQGKDDLDKAMTALAGNAKIPHWIIHDLRRSARTLMSRAGVDGRIAEKVLGHQLPGVESVYDRWGYDPERADALLKLSNLIGEILTRPTKGSGNVVSINRR